MFVQHNCSYCMYIPMYDPSAHRSRSIAMAIEKIGGPGAGAETSWLLLLFLYNRELTPDLYWSNMMMCINVARPCFRAFRDLTFLSDGGDAIDWYDGWWPNNKKCTSNIPMSLELDDDDRHIKLNVIDTRMHALWGWSARLSWCIVCMRMLWHTSIHSGTYCCDWVWRMKW